MIYTDNYPSVEPRFYRELIPGEHWKGETTFRLKTTATGQQLRSTSTTAAGQQTSNVTPRTRATMKRAPTVEERQVQASSRATPPKAQKTNPTATPMVVLNGEQDYWERRGTKWIRHHLQPRRTLFIPIDGPGHPPTSTLEPYRTTHAINIQTDEVSQIKDEWVQQTCLQNYITRGRVQPPSHSKMSLKLHLRMMYYHHQSIQTHYRKQEEQEVDHNLHSLQSKRWKNTHLHTCPTEVGVLFVSKQKASKMPTNNSNQSSESYRLTLHTSGHLQMSKALQYLQQLMYNHSCAWHLQYQTKQCSMTT